MQRAGGSLRGRPGMVTLPVPPMGDAQKCIVIEWAKAVGSSIKVGEVLCYVERDEVTDEVRASVAGVLVEQCAALEDSVPVGAPLVVIDVGGGQAAADPGGASRSCASAGLPAPNAELLAAQERMVGLQQAEREAAEILKQLAANAKAGGFPLPPGLSLAGNAGAPAGALDFPRPPPPGLSLNLGIPNAGGAATDFQLPPGFALSGLGLPAPPPGATAAVAAELQRSLGLGARPSGPDFPRPPNFPLPAASAATSMSQDMLRGQLPRMPTGMSPSGAPTFQQHQRPQRSPQQGGGLSAASIAAAVAKATAASQAPERREAAKPAKEEKPKEEDKIEKLRCHLHKKHNKACKFCQRYQSAKQQAEEDAAEKQTQKERKPAAETFNCSPLLKEQVVNCSYYKSLLSTETVPDLIVEIKQFATDTMEAYRNSMEPSCFMCCVYRLFTLNLTEDELRRFIDYADSPVVRCVGLLCLRYVLPPEQLWDRLEDYLLDDADVIVTDAAGREIPRSIGEYVEDLLLKEKYFTTPLPRIPASVRRKLEEGLAPMVQYRKRTIANRKVFFGGQREVNMPVEVCENGIWASGKAIEVNTRMPSRLMVRVQLDSGREVMAHIGKIVMRGTAPPRERSGSRSRSRSRGRSRSRSRGKGRDASPDWSYTKGKSDSQLVEELRERGRVDAVCSHRKDYAKRLPRFESGLAIKREKGSAEAKLIEEETFIAPGMRRQRETNIVEEEERERGERLTKRRTDEEDERQRRLKDIYEKYGSGTTVKKAPEKGSRGSDLEGPDTMRLG